MRKIFSVQALRRALIAGSALCACVAPSSAQAAVQVGPAASAGMSPCTNFTFSVAIIECAGGYDGNMLQSSLTDPTGIAALVALGASNSGTFLEPKLEGLNSNTGVINFATLLTGMTVFAFHAGGAGDGDQGTFFFRFDAGAGVDVITITDRLNSNETGLSNAALFQTSPVPEPSTWAMMLMGFGAMGYALRRRRRIPDVLQAA